MDRKTKFHRLLVSVLVFLTGCATLSSPISTSSPSVLDDPTIVTPNPILISKATARLRTPPTWAKRFLINRKKWDSSHHWIMSAVVRQDKYPAEHIEPTLDQAQHVLAAGIQVSFGFGHLGQKSYDDWFSREFWNTAAKEVRKLNDSKEFENFVSSVLYDVEPYIYSDWADKSKKYPALSRIDTEGDLLTKAMAPFIEELSKFDEVVIEQGHPVHLMPYVLRAALPTKVKVIVSGNEMKYWPYCGDLSNPAIFNRFDEHYNELVSMWAKHGIEYRPTFYVRGLADQKWRKRAETIVPIFNGFFAGRDAILDYQGHRCGSREAYYCYDGTEEWLKNLVEIAPGEDRCDRLELPPPVIEPPKKDDGKIEPPKKGEGEIEPPKKDGSIPNSLGGP